MGHKSWQEIKAERERRVVEEMDRWTSFIDEKPIRLAELGKIKSTSLGFEDHGIFTSYLQLDFSGYGQGFGGYGLDDYNKQTDERVSHDALYHWMTNVMRIVSVDEWEKVAGKLVYALRNEPYGKIIGIASVPAVTGHYRVFIIEEMFETLRKKDAA